MNVYYQESHGMLSKFDSRFSAYLDALLLKKVGQEMTFAHQVAPMTIRITEWIIVKELMDAERKSITEGANRAVAMCILGIHIRPRFTEYF